MSFFLPLAEEAGDTSWLLNRNNWREAESLLPEPVLKRVQAGDYYYTVIRVDPERFKQNYTWQFWEVSAGNAGKYDVDPSTCGLRDVTTAKVATLNRAGCPLGWSSPTANAR